MFKMPLLVCNLKKKKLEFEEFYPFQLDNFPHFPDVCIFILSLPSFLLYLFCHVLHWLFIFCFLQSLTSGTFFFAINFPLPTIFSTANKNVC